MWKAAGLPHYSENDLGISEAAGEDSACRPILLGRLGRTQVAVKLFSNYAAYTRELYFHRQIRHPNVLLLIGTARVRGMRALVFERLVDNLCHSVARRGLPTSVLVRKLEEVAAALEYLHLHEIVHGDVKSQNILADANSSAKLSDFGFSIELKEESLFLQMPSPSGTRGYICPFFLLTGKANKSMDVYSFGATIEEFVFDQEPLSDVGDGFFEPRNLGNEIAVLGEEGAVQEAVELGWHSETARRLLDLARRCKAPRIAERPSISEVVWEIQKIGEMKTESLPLHLPLARHRSAASSTLSDLSERMRRNSMMPSQQSWEVRTNPVAGSVRGSEGTASPSPCAAAGGRGRGGSLGVESSPGLAPFSEEGGGRERMAGTTTRSTPPREAPSLSNPFSPGSFHSQAPLGFIPAAAAAGGEASCSPLEVPRGGWAEFSLPPTIKHGASFSPQQQLLLANPFRPGGAMSGPGLASESVAPAFTLRLSHPLLEAAVREMVVSGEREKMEAEELLTVFGPSLEFLGFWSGAFRENAEFLKGAGYVQTEKRPVHRECDAAIRFQSDPLEVGGSSRYLSSCLLPPLRSAAVGSLVKDEGGEKKGRLNRVGAMELLNAIEEVERSLSVCRVVCLPPVQLSRERVDASLCATAEVTPYPSFSSSSSSFECLSSSSPPPAGCQERGQKEREGAEPCPPKSSVHFAPFLSVMGPLSSVLLKRRKGGGRVVTEADDLVPLYRGDSLTLLSSRQEQGEGGGEGEQEHSGGSLWDLRPLCQSPQQSRLSSSSSSSNVFTYVLETSVMLEPHRTVVDQQEVGETETAETASLGASMAAVPLTELGGIPSSTFVQVDDPPAPPHGLGCRWLF
uniref:Protein kinase domain-containing protein n=1 Tax=Chromera velia CCMP2878 TaxID=1169474 RepID=A0A0G4FQU6_9ALVE|eukprot:Cvel_18281.t1-p1 / transcript=Cvel_18281.t1 / gene=Cvel_18281 / organism=Chromera_velia_CCMP2878 / gene_product=Serine/threonine-protein kinase-like protein, putative / transcript_product=Serine/threonine-protein kinase-like protein, putative / location=Cvel_scaffold1506:18540-21543(+) / protein_length=854 / sequence_SO=supercontig / SO=protein_coding / is_pseudo=false